LHDAGRVRFCNPLCGLGEVADDGAQLGPLLVHHPVERVARHQLHRDEVDRLDDRTGVSRRFRFVRRGRPARRVLRRAQLVAANLVDGDDVRVVQRRGRLRLGDEAAHALVVAHQVRRQDLQRDAAPKRLVAGDVDLAHPAGPERGDDSVMGDLVLGLERPRQCASTRGLPERTDFIRRSP
jgi:hypothetical protein